MPRGPWRSPIPWTRRRERSSQVRGGGAASRSKHIVAAPDGRFRRLVPDELDQLQGFPKGWTDTGMTDINRAFCMGNALVVGIPHLIGQVIASSLDGAEGSE
ncbi:MAG: DNA cytosine methyltransferase [Collinsella stercoris]|uniref:DNA cytosine methyltransferase n=1 Tax=Collinsella stercoris TaxID=147206 RepID=UPI0039958250